MKLNPIQYDIDFYFLRNGKEAAMQIDFIKALAKTRNINMLKTKYVQRFIDFHWYNGHRAMLRFNLAIQSLIFIFVLFETILVHYPNGTPETKARRITHCINLILVLIYVLGFELTQLYK